MTEPKRQIIITTAGGTQPLEVPPQETARPEPDRSTVGRKVFEQRRKWPRACIRCGGDGGVAEGEDEEIEIGLCESCLGAGKCPRCASSLPSGWRERIEDLEGEPVQCASCRWKDGDEPVLDLSEDP